MLAQLPSRPPPRSDRIIHGRWVHFSTWYLNKTRPKAKATLVFPAYLIPSQLRLLKMVKGRFVQAESLSRTSAVPNLFLRKVHRSRLRRPHGARNVLPRKGTGPTYVLRRRPDHQVKFIAVCCAKASCHCGGILLVWPKDAQRCVLSDQQQLLRSGPTLCYANMSSSLSGDWSGCLHTSLYADADSSGLQSGACF